MNTAYFVKHPRVAADLRVPHLVNQERPYDIVKDILLSQIDYANFVADMVADRWFIGDNAEICSEGETMKCLFIRRRGKPGGILVVPEDRAFVKWAAFVE